MYLSPMGGNKDRYVTVRHMSVLIILQTQRVQLSDKRYTMKNGT